METCLVRLGWPKCDCVLRLWQVASLTPRMGRTRPQSNSRNRKEIPRSLHRERGWRFGLRRTANSGVCTMCTLKPSDCVVHRSDRAGFRMFPGLPSVRAGWNAVRVPPWARITPRQRGFCF